MKFPLLAATILLSLPSAAQVPDNNPDTDQAEETNASESSGPDRFWQASVSGGHYMVALERISNISMHEYVLDGNLIVNEVTIDTAGRAMARFYHIDPVAADTGRGGVDRVVERGRELLDRAGQRAGTEVHEMVQKNYPATTHAGMIEYRILHLPDLRALYDSVREAWTDGRGRTLTIEFEE